MLPKIDSMWFFFINLVLYFWEKRYVFEVVISGFLCKGFDSNSTVLLNKNQI